MKTIEKTLPNLMEDLRYQLRALDKKFIDKDDFVNAVEEIYDYYTNL